jgi:hypothetical protein
LATPPDLPAVHDDFEKLRYTALLDVWKQERAAALEALTEERKLVEKRRDEQLANENALRAAVHGAYLDVAKAAAERSLQRATFVTGAAGTMATIYSGLLALVYSVSKEGTSPLPAYGMYPAVFLGISLVLSTAYIAYITRSFRAGRHLRNGLGPGLQEERLATFLDWAISSSYRRAGALRTAVVSLGIGVALTPLPFLRLAEASATRLIQFGGGILVAYLLLFEGILWWRSRRSKAAENDVRPTRLSWYRRNAQRIRTRWNDLRGGKPPDAAEEQPPTAVAAPPEGAPAGGSAEPAAPETPHA